MTALKNFRVDSFVSGLAIKAPVAVATTGPVSLAGEQTVNFVSLIVGDRCLVKDQADPIENGIYNVETSAWQRAGDMDGNRDIVGGTVVPAYRALDGLFVYWIITGAPDGLSPGTDALTFITFYDSALAGSALPVSLGQNSVLISDAVGGWVEESDITIDPTGNLITTGAIASSDGTEDLSIATASAITTLTGSGGYDHIRVLPEVRLDSFLYSLERNVPGADRTGYGQFWVRDDGPPNTPVFTDNQGLTTVLNGAANFAAPLQLFDEEEIQLGSGGGGDARIFWTAAGLGGSPGLRLQFLAPSSILAITSAPEMRLYTALGTGWLSIENVGIGTFNILELNRTGFGNILYDWGPWDHQGHGLITPNLVSYGIGHLTAGSVSGVMDIDFEDANAFFLTLTENITTMTFSNFPTSRLAQIEVEILQDSVARTIAWPAAVKWPAGGTAPDLSITNATYLVHFRTRDAGATILGTFVENFS